jgi:hypothetical protein
MKNTFKIHIIIFPALILVSCGLTGGNSKNPENADKRTLQEYKLDEMNLIDDAGMVITTNVPEAKEELEAEIPVDSTGQNTGSSQEEQYFSAQVFASKSSAEAKEYKESIATLFDDDVQIEYQAPYYKVCVGRAQGIDNAQELIEKVNAMGFPKAWLVKIK